MKKNAKELIIPLVRLALDLDTKGEKRNTGEENCDIPALSREEIGEVMRLSRYHSIENLAAEAILKSRIPLDVADAQKLESIRMTALFEETNRAHTLSVIGELFEREGIDYMPLKGSVIKHFYPRDDMRSSSDIDILVRKKDVKRAEALLLGNEELRLLERGPHDIGFATSSGVHVELHFSLVEDKFAKALLDVWENASLAEGEKHRYIMSDEDFYLYTVIHAAKHFMLGGCGIRTLIDVFYWCRHKSLDSGYLESRTRECGVYEFMLAFESLAEHWFGESGTSYKSGASSEPGANSESGTSSKSGANPDEDLLSRLADYIIDNATFGTIENRIAVERSSDGKTSKKKQKGRFAYLLERCFMPYGKMKHRYPVLKKLPILLPIYWVVRWFEALSRGQAGVIRDSIALNQSLSEEKREQVARLYSDIGLIK